LITDNELHNTGVGCARSMRHDPGGRKVVLAPGVTLRVAQAIIGSMSGPKRNDLGLQEITQKPEDRWRYRTPSLRNVALTAPYVHDGCLGTLRELIARYDAGGVPHPLQDRRLRPLNLSDSEVLDLIAFLMSLTGGNVATLVSDALAAPVGERGPASQLPPRRITSAGSPAPEICGVAPVVHPNVGTRRTFVSDICHHK
jgi:cytochrome c peroxidase